MITDGRFIELEMKKLIRRMVSKLLWEYTAYHSGFVKKSLNTEPSIPNYNSFECGLISMIRERIKGINRYFESVGVYVDGVILTRDTLLNTLKDTSIVMEKIFSGMM